MNCRYCGKQEPTRRGTADYVFAEPGVCLDCAEEHVRVQKMLETMPFLRGWLEELGQKPEALKTVNINNNTYRDEAEEVRTGSQWQIWKPGETFTVQMVLADYSLHTKSFSREEWGKLFTPEEKPE